MLKRICYFFQLSYFTFLVFLPTIVLGQVAIADPDDFHGLRTKWSIYPDSYGIPNTGTSRHSIVPQLSDLSVAEFMKYIETTGANSVTLNLEARNGITLTEPMHDTYALTALQINNYEYTCGQRNIQLTDFLVQVQQAIDEGKIDGTLRFHIHQRLYLNKNAEKEADFVKDFVNFINLAKARGIDHLIAGIRLGEHGTKGRDYLLSSALEMAEAINTQTDGWLKNNAGMEWSGDNYGLLFTDIDTQSEASIFFEDISKHTGYFAFCFKAFGTKGELKDAGYDATSLSDWSTFVGEDLGLNDLKQFIDSYKATYPLHANVIFIGDSGDAMKQVSDNEYTTLTSFFTQAGEGFQGIIGVNAYRRYDKTIDDNHLYIFDALEDKNSPVEKTLSAQRWAAWPLHDGDLREKAIIVAECGIGGVISPSGPLTIDFGQSVNFSVEPSLGFVIEDVVVDGQSLGAVDEFQLSAVQAVLDVMVTFVKEDGPVWTRPLGTVLVGQWIQNDGTDVWNFSSNGQWEQSTATDDTRIEKGVWWYNEEINTSNGAGGLICITNDDFVEYELQLSETNKDQMIVKISENQELNFTRVNTGAAIAEPDCNAFYVSNQTLYVQQSSGMQVFTLVNLSGQTVWRSRTVSTQYDLTHLPRGIYILNSSASSKTESIKVIL